MRQTIGLLTSLFLIFSAAGDAMALQVMYPHISKDAEPEISRPVRAARQPITPRYKNDETEAMRGVPPADIYNTNSFKSQNNRTSNNLVVNARTYQDAKTLEREMEMAKELGKVRKGVGYSPYNTQASRTRARAAKYRNNKAAAKKTSTKKTSAAKTAPAKQATGKNYKEIPKKLNKEKLQANKEKELAARRERIAKRLAERKKDKQLAKEARYAKKEHKYIFDPRNFMKGLLGERVGLGHTYTQQSRPGLQRSYQESDGFRLVRPFDWIEGIDSIDAIGVAGRVELIEEPFPTEGLILDAKKIDVIRFGRWETREQYRSQVLPTYTKAVGTDVYFTYGNLPKFTFTYDYREVYHQFQALYGFKDWDIKTFEFKLEDSRKWYPIGYVSIIPGMKYQIYDSEDAVTAGMSTANDHRDTYYLETLWAPSGVLEFYTKVDASKSNYHDINWKYSPWHWGVRGEVRAKYLPWRMSVNAGWGHSFDKYSPFENFFRKEEFFVDIGHDVTGRIKTSSRTEFIYLELTEDDNMAPRFDTFNPYQADAKVLNSKNKIQYELSKNVFLTGGADHSMGLGFDEFNNFSLYTEIEYYNAGAFRTNFGYRYNRYYNLGDEISCLYFRCFLFM